MQPRFEVADVLRKIETQKGQTIINSWRQKTLHNLKQCRTSELGGHIDACDGCGTISISYNSCRNRHCPKCQGHKSEEWIESRSRELLPVPYFHVVFTLPESINRLALQSPVIVYNTLFESAWETLHTFGKTKGIQLGMIAILHTWGQNLSLHPHLHCIVPGGGVDNTSNWQNIRSDGKFLFSVKALSKVFRAKYIEKLKTKSPINYEQIRQDMWQRPWVVYAKRPFGSPKTVVEYLGRYTHKIAISNHRIKNIDTQNVTFTYKDYRKAGVKKEMTLSHQEFIRRFSQHILPKRYVKIRHYGFLSSTWKRNKLQVLQQKLKVKRVEKVDKPPILRQCPCCITGKLHRIAIFDQRGPPPWYLGVSQITNSCKS